MYSCIPSRHETLWSVCFPLVNNKGFYLSLVNICNKHGIVYWTEFLDYLFVNVYLQKEKVFSLNKNEYKNCLHSMFSALKQVVHLRYQP